MSLPSPYLKIKEAAKRAGISREALLLAIGRGEIPYISFGTGLVQTADLDTWASRPENLARARQMLKAAQNDDVDPRGLSWAESAVKEKYEKEGWTLYRQGEPDFLFLRKLPSGQVEGRFVEVKYNGDRLNPRQRAYHDALRQLGLAVVVERPDDVPEKPDVSMKTQKAKKPRPYGSGGLYRRGRFWWIKYRLKPYRTPEGRTVYRQRSESTHSTNRRVAERLLARRIRSER